MCFFNRYRYPCGHMYWGPRMWRCESRQKAGDDNHASCQVKRVHKYIRITATPRCYKCQETYSPWVTRRYGAMDQRIYLVRPQFVRKLLTTDLPLVPPNEICLFSNCVLDAQHPLPHVVNYTICPTDYCYLEEGHASAHERSLLSTSRGNTVRTHDESQKLEQARMVELTSIVLQAMASHFQTAKVSQSMVLGTSPSGFESMNFSTPEIPRTPSLAPRAGHFKNVVANSRYVAPEDSPYRQLDLQRQEIRLFELFPRIEGKEIEGRFRHIELPQNRLPYTALSYTWGDPSNARSIMLRNRGPRKVRSNLYEFLHQQSQIIEEPKLFWIDALCIDQDNVHERNHQVNLMKKIYVNATNVFVWLGPRSDTSDVAMDYVKKQSGRRIRIRGQGFCDIWTDEQGSALRDLCERSYWRRMWVIQEVLYAQAITVWCGSKSFDWEDVESLYLKFRTLEDTHWIAHHAFVIDVAQSSAAVMVWQRAHWRHPQTPTPRLRTLIEIFRQWQCADVRDKVFALTSMASEDTTIFPDYAMSARDVYFAICNAHPHEGRSFEHMLSQLLGLSERDLGYNSGRQLIEYKVRASDSFVLQKRLDGNW